MCIVSHMYITNPPTPMRVRLDSLLRGACLALACPSLNKQRVLFAMRDVITTIWRENLVRFGRCDGADAAAERRRSTAGFVSRGQAAVTLGATACGESFAFPASKFALQLRLPTLAGMQAGSCGTAGRTA